MHTETSAAVNSVTAPGQQVLRELHDHGQYSHKTNPECKCPHPTEHSNVCFFPQTMWGHQEVKISNQAYFISKMLKLITGLLKSSKESRLLHVVGSLICSDKCVSHWNKAATLTAKHLSKVTLLFPVHSTGANMNLTHNMSYCGHVHGIWKPQKSLESLQVHQVNLWKS